MKITSAQSKPTLLVISNCETKLEHESRSFLQTHWNVIVANKQENIRISTIDHALFYNLNQDSLVKIALGLTDNLESDWFSQLIYHEIPISIVLEPSFQQWLQIDEKKHRYSDYIKRIQNYKKFIENLGIPFLRMEQLKPRKQKLSNHEMEHSNTSKTLIAQEDIINFSGDTLVVQKGTIITPLARDKARERGIEISYSQSAGRLETW